MGAGALELESGPGALGLSGWPVEDDIVATPALESRFSSDDLRSGRARNCSTMVQNQSKDAIKRAEAQIQHTCRIVSVDRTLVDVGGGSSKTSVLTWQY